MGVSIDADRLRQEMARRGLDGQQLATLARVTPATISHALNRRRLGLTTLRAIARVLAATAPLEGAEFLAPTGQVSRRPAQRSGAPEVAASEARETARGHRSPRPA
jgi:transcriptional regulator with XRE-family HTH domain